MVKKADVAKSSCEIAMKLPNKHCPGFKETEEIAEILSKHFFHWEKCWSYSIDYHEWGANYVRSYLKQQRIGYCFEIWML